MTRIIYIALFLLIPGAAMVHAQDTRPELYDPEADARSQIQTALETAGAENKHVFIQVGGNWCSWCHLFHEFIGSDTEISSLLEENYVVIRINHSKENRNEHILSELNYPQRFGFPVFVILDQRGHVIHIQDSALLEEGRGYSRKKVVGFLKNWTPRALDPSSYQ